MSPSEIVDAALELIGARGFKGATIAAIAERVGLTDAGLLFAAAFLSQTSAVITKGATFGCDAWRVRRESA